MTKSFDDERFRALARERALRLGQPLLSVASTPSTNDLALEAARSGAPHGATFVADEQTRGRGRQGRAWHSAPGESLLVSIVSRPKLALAEAPALALAVGLAVRATSARLLGEGARVTLKWPNDVLCDEKKLAGVLIETQVQSSELLAAVVGVGLNLGSVRFPPELAGLATSLRLLGVQGIEREGVLVELLSEVDLWTSRFEAGGIKSILSELSVHDALRGRRVTVEGVRGTAEGIDENGRLLVRDDHGQLHALISGHVILEGDGSARG